LKININHACFVKLKNVKQRKDGIYILITNVELVIFRYAPDKETVLETIMHI